jgi:proteasome assembly chaperone (PAC2) family protein
MAEARELRGLRNPVVVAAFGGWNDAGGAASGVIDHLVERYEAGLAFAIDPEDYYDFQVNRPLTKLVDGRRELEWPTTEVLVANLPERDLVLIAGPEPNYHWQDFTASIASMLRSIKPELVVLLGALLTDAPHSRPVPVAGSSDSPELSEELGLELSAYEGPTGILGVISNECGRLNIPAVSLWASVPHYVAEPPNPKATLALLSALEDILNLPLDSGDLAEASNAWVEQVNDLVADDPDIAGYVTSLEERRDEASLDPNGESIAAEFERYLRRRNRRRG